MFDFVSIPEKRMKILRRNKKLIGKLKDLVDVEITINDEIKIEAEDSLLVMCVKRVIKAFGRGFDFEDALLLLDDKYLLDIVDIKQFSGKSSSRLVELRGRVIGTNGKTKNTIEKLTDAKISVYGKTICIIGRWDSVQCAREAIEMLLQGRKHGSVYRFLEQRAET